MSENIRYEVHLAALSLGTGIGLMMVYDLLRILRMAIPHNGFWTGLEDIGYWIYCALMTFSLLYEQNDGSLRAYVIGGTFLGMWIYQYLVSRKLLKYLKKGQEYLKMKMRKQRRKSNRVKR